MLWLALLGAVEFEFLLLLLVILLMLLLVECRDERRCACCCRCSSSLGVLDWGRGCRGDVGEDGEGGVCESIMVAVSCCAKVTDILLCLLWLL